MRALTHTHMQTCQLQPSPGMARLGAKLGCAKRLSAAGCVVQVSQQNAIFQHIFKTLSRLETVPVRKT